MHLNRNICSLLDLHMLRRLKPSDGPCPTPLKRRGNHLSRCSALPRPQGTYSAACLHDLLVAHADIGDDYILQWEAESPACPTRINNMRDPVMISRLVAGNRPDGLISHVLLPYVSAWFFF